MCRFIETIRVERGQACNLQLHQARVDATMARFFPGIPQALADRDAGVDVGLDYTAAAPDADDEAADAA